MQTPVKCCCMFCIARPKTRFSERTSISRIGSSSPHWTVPVTPFSGVISPTVSSLSPEPQIARPKTAFQRLNNKFEQVLAELKQVHFRTKKPKSLPPIQIQPTSSTPIIEVGKRLSRYINVYYIVFIFNV